jgi:hypothetical protein
VTELDGRNVKELVFWSSGVFHEDAWLMPIRPEPPEEVWQEVQRNNPTLTREKAEEMAQAFGI